MTRLRKMMLEELQRRNFAESTTEAYIRAVKEFSQYFNSSPDRLGPRHIREYQASLFQKRKFSPNTVAQHLARSVSRARAIAGWKSAAENFFRPVMCM